MTKIVYINAKGKLSHSPPEGVPPFVIKPLFDGSGISPKDGFPCRPVPDFEVRKIAKKK